MESNKNFIDGSTSHLFFFLLFQTPAWCIIAQRAVNVRWKMEKQHASVRDNVQSIGDWSAVPMDTFILTTANYTGLPV